jgi:hypothetical protein
MADFADDGIFVLPFDDSLEIAREAPVHDLADEVLE